MIRHVWLAIPLGMFALGGGCARGQPPLAEPTTGALALPGARLHYETAGSGDPVVFIHGGQMDSRLWDDQFARYAREFRVIRYDVRGFGRTGRSVGRFASEEDLRELLRALDVQLAHIVGLSLGGRIGVDFALTHPRMVRSLVLAGPGLSGFPWTPSEGPWLDSVVVAYEARDSVRMTELWLQHEYMIPVMERPELAPRVRRLARENASAWMQPDSLERPLSPPAFGRLPEIRAPVLALVGSRDVADIRRIVDTIAAAVPGARKVVLQGAGHILNLERREEFDRVVLWFLREN